MWQTQRIWQLGSCFALLFHETVHKWPCVRSVRASDARDVASVPFFLSCWLWPASRLRMKAYQLTNRGRTYPTFIVDSNGQFQTSLEEFKRAYGFNRLDRRNRDEYMRAMTNSRLSLFKDKARLNLRCNPMTDDLALVFSEWLAKKPGFSTVNEKDLSGGIPVEQYEFPF